MLTEYLIRDYSCDLASALKIVYESNLYALLHSDDSDLYIQSPSYLYHLLQQEIN